MKYGLADPGVFNTIQGEGYLSGTPMIFVRLAGCSVNCNGCDTNYIKAQVLDGCEIADKVKLLRQTTKHNEGWIWITGGEPLDYNLSELLCYLKLEGRIALITSGKKDIGGLGNMIDFLSVSPHGKPNDLKIIRGSQVNLVPGLGGTILDDWKDFDFSGFKYKYVTPYDKDINSLYECMKWVWKYPDWKLGIQAHKYWNIP